MRKLLLILITSFLLISTAHSQSELLKTRIDRFEGGQNSADLDTAIEPNQGESFKNIVLSKKGKLLKRTGQSLFNASAEAVFTGIGRYDPDATTSKMVIASGITVAAALSTDTSWTILNPTDSLTTGKDTEFVQANDLYFVLNGTDYTAAYTGTTWDPGGLWAGGSPPIATTGVWLRNYLFLAGQPSEPDWIYVSNNLVPRTFTVTDLVKVNTGDGQIIQRLEAFRLNEIIAYKERSIFVVDITGNTLANWTVQPISKSVGCIAKRSVVSLGNDHWFLSSDPIAVRSLVRSEFDKILVDIVSKPIQDIFDGTGDLTINISQISRACAVLFDNKYILAIPTGSSTINNTVVAYDFISQAWYIIDGWFPAAWVVFDNKLYCINEDTGDGRVVRCFTGIVGDFASTTTVATSFSVETPDQPIEFEYISKAYDFENPENYKSLDSIEVEFDTTGNYTATLHIDLDNDGWQDVGTIDLDGDAITLPVDLPFTLTSGGIARKTFHLQQYGEFKKIKVKVTQSGISEECVFQRATIFARMRKWRRE